MTIDACAQLVHARDPDRFRAAMVTPVEARAVLLPLYAFASEVARAAWVTGEPLIANMRLQWWRDALGEIAAGGPVRAHEVSTTLAGVVGSADARRLLAAVDARVADIERLPFDDGAALLDYARATAAPVAEVAARNLGAAQDAAIAGDCAAAAGLARFLAAANDLKARGWDALAGIDDVTLAGLADAARSGLDADLRRARGATGLPWLARAALVETAGAREMLGQVARHPSRVRTGLKRPARPMQTLRLALHARAVMGRQARTRSARASQ